MTSSHMLFSMALISVELTGTLNINENWPYIVL